MPINGPQPIPGFYSTVIRVTYNAGDVGEHTILVMIENKHDSNNIEGKAKLNRCVLYLNP